MQSCGAKDAQIWSRSIHKQLVDVLLMHDQNEDGLPAECNVAAQANVLLYQLSMVHLLFASNCCIHASDSPALRIFLRQCNRHENAAMYFDSRAGSSKHCHWIWYLWLTSCSLERFSCVLAFLAERTSFLFSFQAALSTSVIPSRRFCTSCFFCSVA